MQSGLPLDTTVFTLDVPTNPRSVAVQTDDPTKADTYYLRVTVSLEDHPLNAGASKDFTIRIDDLCEDSYVITPTAPTDNVEYLVARTAITTLPFDPFVVDPPYCPFTYAFDVSPSLTGPGAPAIQMDQAARTFTVETVYTDNVGVNTVTLRALTPLGTDTGVGFSFLVDI